MGLFGLELSEILPGFPSNPGESCLDSLIGLQLAGIEGPSWLCVCGGVSGGVDREALSSLDLEASGIAGDASSVAEQSQRWPAGGTVCVSVLRG